MAEEQLCYMRRRYFLQWWGLSKLILCVQIRRMPAPNKTAQVFSSNLFFPYRIIYYHQFLWDFGRIKVGEFLRALWPLHIILLVTKMIWPERWDSIVSVIFFLSFRHIFINVNWIPNECGNAILLFLYIVTALPISLVQELCTFLLACRSSRPLFKLRDWVFYPLPYFGVRI